ncbi:Uncharacterised protein [Morganella morganii]|nr:Uncharacterised protein [Morganella morganii]
MFLTTIINISVPGHYGTRRYNSCLIEANSYFLLVSQYVDTFTSDQSEYNDKHNLNYSSYGHNTGECTIPEND